LDSISSQGHKTFLVVPDIKKNKLERLSPAGSQPRQEPPSGAKSLSWMKGLMTNTLAYLFWQTIEKKVF
jgi:hypothetical protein